MHMPRLVCGLSFGWCLVGLFQLFLCSPERKAANLRIIRGVEVLTGSRWSPYTKFTDIPTLSVCSMLCVANKQCVSVLYDESARLCQLSACLLDLYTSNTGSDLTYLEVKDETSDGRFYVQVAKYAGYRDCQEIYEAGERCSGVFKLQHDSSSADLEVFCEFDGQYGWTVIQRRLDGSVDFDRGWDDYVDGFGDMTGEYWIGLEVMHYLTSTRSVKLNIYLEDHAGNKRSANYSSFYVGVELKSYNLQLSGYSGDVRQNDMPQSGTPFVTKDRDNSCAASYHGGWWFESCFSAHLNGRWYPANSSGGDNSPCGQGILWDSWRGRCQSLKAVTMRVTSHISPQIYH